MGEVGKRIKVLVVKVEKIIAHEGAYGTTGIHKMTDATGNDLVWFANSNWLTEGRTYTVAATVKRHGDYQGRKQTTVNRVEVWSEEGLAAQLAKAAARKSKKAAK